MTTDGTQTQDGVTPDSETTETPKTYTQAELDKAIRDARTAVTADVGRLKAESDKAYKAATAASERLVRLQREQEERELESAKNEPDKLTAIRERQTRRQKETELEEAQKKLDEANTKLQELSTRDAETTRERTTREIAERLRVDTSRLTKLAKYTDGSAEAIEEIAKELPKLAPKQTTNFRPDSSEAAGGTPRSVEQVQKDYIAGKINTVQYAEKMKALGKQA